MIAGPQILAPPKLETGAGPPPTMPEPLKELVSAGGGEEITVAGRDATTGPAKEDTTGAVLTTVPPIMGAAPPVVTILDLRVVTVAPGARLAARGEKDIFNLNLFLVYSGSIDLKGRLSGL